MTAPNGNHNSIHATRRAGKLSSEECAFIDCERAKNRPWHAIARMLGRSEHDVRDACDTGYGEGAQ